MGVTRGEWLMWLASITKRNHEIQDTSKWNGLSNESEFGCHPHDGYCKSLRVRRMFQIVGVGVYMFGIAESDLYQEG